MMWWVADAGAGGGRITKTGSYNIPHFLSWEDTVSEGTNYYLLDGWTYDAILRPFQQYFSYIGTVGG